MKKLALTTAFLGTILLASGTMAQTAPTTPSASGTTQFITQLSPDTMLLSDLMDLDVMGPDNKDIGDVEDVVLGRDGKVAAVVIEVDKGIGDRTLALPMSAFQLTQDAATTGSVQTGASAPAMRDSDDMHLKLNISVDQLKSAPEFDDND
jgi:hypothetical protein